MIMKAIEVTSFGASQVLHLAERLMSVPSVGEVLIRVSASGIDRLKWSPTGMLAKLF